MVYCSIHRVNHYKTSWQIVDSLTLHIKACYMSKRSAYRVANRMNAEPSCVTQYIVVETKPDDED